MWPMVCVVQLSEKIVLDKHKRQITTKETQFIHLQYPPQYVLVKLLQMNWKAYHLVWSQ
jgi:hypothetical protein